MADLTKEQKLSGLTGVTDIVDLLSKVNLVQYKTGWTSKHLAADAIREITRLRQLLSEKWRPMNIAPLDGTEILIRTEDGCVSCSWDNLDQEWVAGWLGITLLKGDPLGWMPIHKHEMHRSGK